MRFELVAVALVFVACSKPQPPSSTHATPSAPSPEPATHDPLSPPSGEQPVATTAAPDPVERPLLPPNELGKANVSLLGCLAESVKPTSSPRSVPPPDTVSVTPTGLGLGLRHQLRHNCCAKAQVESTLDAHSVRIVERLSGEVCRCMCSSVIRAAVRLAPGDYQVSVSQIDASGTETKLHEGSVTVASLRR